MGGGEARGSHDGAALRLALEDAPDGFVGDAIGCRQLPPTGVNSSSGCGDALQVRQLAAIGDSAVSGRRVRRMCIIEGTV
jgi:hypothetical protein